MMVFALSYVKVFLGQICILQLTGWFVSFHHRLRSCLPFPWLPNFRLLRRFDWNCSRHQLGCLEVGQVHNGSRKGHFVQRRIWSCQRAHCCSPWWCCKYNYCQIQFMTTFAIMKLPKQRHDSLNFSVSEMPFSTTTNVQCNAEDRK